MKQDVQVRCFFPSIRPPKRPRSGQVEMQRQQIRGIAQHAHSNFFIPPLSKSKGKSFDSNDLLIKAGFLRQAYAGIYHMLPLGLRVQSKIEALIEKHMGSLKASKLSLSSISSRDLWQRSGRLSTGSELFRFKDRKDTDYLLSPTHEEEITSLVGGLVTSYRDLPVRVYQIGRKYRDEKRPRGGLLRGREFLMKDLYTFDESEELARSTYEAVRAAYRNFFDELKIDYIEAQADSGNMGGTLSHEYHLESSKGEDNILCCSECKFARNEELVDHVDYVQEHLDLDMLSGSLAIEAGLSELVAISLDKKTLVKAYTQAGDKSRQINPYAVKAAVDGVVELDRGVEDPLEMFTVKQALGRRLLYIFDDTVAPAARAAQIMVDYDFIRRNALETVIVTRSPSSAKPMTLAKKLSGDECPSCGIGRLSIKTAIEAGHTFHLGTRYSARLGTKIMLASGTESVPMVMGCHGIGVSRLIAATASCLADEKGLNWPRALAPFQVSIVPRSADPTFLAGASSIYKTLTSDSPGEDGIDAIIDDRAHTPLPWKLTDADLIGYPIIIVLGRAWAEQKVEVQCRRLAVKAEVNIEEVKQIVEDLLSRIDGN